ncbi:MAG: polyketide biosynthesis methyltransferase [Oceanospirillaceae bacterium]|nr:polyketide biosynthesis methyltransferase [Oceanospirillaceae bacterium]MBT11617.1 polyketide biosynthesis methyltransferase [Oceanospirillaceae bacterium]|tara:strand:- start:39668 stop:40543 length:876 start_codon:yes stop_codon:yes gene_type:complete
MTSDIRSAQSAPDTSRISISAHYTGYVWYRHGLSEQQFVTPAGRFAALALAPVNAFLRLVAGADIDTFLLQRHQVIDHLLTELIEKEGVTQVVEIAAGLSPRGYRLRQRFPHIRYLEADLPAMAARKAQLLATLETGPEHQVYACNILQPEGPESIHSLLNKLNPVEKTVIVTEGLVNYFELPVIRAVWSRIASGLKRFSGGYYVTDLYPDFADHPSYRYVKFAQKLVGFFTRGQWPLHYPSDDAIHAGFRQDGFSHTEVHDPAGFYDTLALPRARTRTLVRLIRADVNDD